ncbi:MAG: DUF2058 domain-containing protein [bacterium]
MSSLRDQLLKSGLASKKQAKRAQHQQRQQKTQQKKQEKSGIASESPSEIDRALEAKRLAKIEQDRLLNLERQKQLHEKEIYHQINQFIQANLVPFDDDSDISYNFTHNEKIRKIFVSSRQRQQVIDGQLVIAELDQSYVLIGHAVARRIEEKAPQRVIILEDEPEFDEDDPYAQFVVPDDLVW